ncbi:hypothetical protein ACI48D_19320 [Massilia sp. LXY-6]|uniref:hypothetical protein n=1 Tax=Massilia sp. LXY-6 TaxID=3379823 RepID=UPI003EDF7F15
MSFFSLRFPSPAAAGALLLLSVATVACTTPQERAAQKQAEMANLMAVYGRACSRLGYAVDSDPWRSCILSLSTKDDLQRYGPSPGWGPGYWYGGGYWGRHW